MSHNEQANSNPTMIVYGRRIQRVYIFKNLLAILGYFNISSSRSMARGETETYLPKEAAMFFYFVGNSVNIIT